MGKHSIKNTELAVRFLGRWDPADLAVIERLEAFYDWEAKRSSLILGALFQRPELRKLSGERDSDRSLGRAVAPYLLEEYCRVQMRFDNISNFHLERFGGPLWIAGFCIEELEGRGWEQFNFKVGVDEGSEIGFYCSEIELLSAEKFILRKA